MWFSKLAIFVTGSTCDSKRVLILINVVNVFNVYYLSVEKYL